MTSQFGQIAFVVWRESAEALLGIGILNAWLAKQTDDPQAPRARRFLWSGVVAGLLVAIGLGAVLLGFAEFLSDHGQEYFQTGMVLVAAALIVQMVFWMRKHGRTLKRDLESGMQETLAAANWWGLFILALLAVAREGSETVVFLYGILAGGSGEGLGATLGAIAGGLAFATLTYWLLQVGSRLISWRRFFKVTEIMLLLLAGALILNGANHLVSLGVLPFSGRPLWDTSRLLDDTGVIGGLVSALTGYRARPDLLDAAVLFGYWTLMLLALNRNGHTRAAKPNAQVSHA